MNFKDPAKVEEIIHQMREADAPRARNRANINSLFNGDPPYTEKEAEENSIETNVNFLEAANIAHNARQQFSNAFLKPGNFFTVTVDIGPAHKRADWGRVITKEINKYMKRSMCYMETLRSTMAQVVLHGKGPVLWEDKWAWCPKSYGIEDVLMPSKTKVSLENLDHFAVFCEYTPGSLYRMTHGKFVDPGWNMPMVQKMLAEVKDRNQRDESYNEALSPEKLQERYKANAGYYDSDAVPTINCWKFFSRSQDSEDGWMLKIVPDLSDKPKEGKRAFLYESNRTYGAELPNLLHVQFADGANKAPFYYHSVRSIGFLLYAVCHLQNRLRCRLSDSAFEQMLWYFRMQSADDRERLEKVNLHHLGIIPEGLSFVTGQERFTPNERFVSMVMSQNRQSMSEASASFTQDVNDGTTKEMTATETMARVNSMNAMVGGMLGLAYTYQGAQYREICRRFCLKGSQDKDVKKFRQAVLSKGVPEEVLNVEEWNVEPERTMGQGNKILEIAQADKLMAAKNAYEPDAQREILHIFTEANTDDPQLAERLVPLDKVQKVSDATIRGQLAAGALMQGLPLEIEQGINHIDYVEALLMAMDTVTQRIENSGGMATAEQVLGLHNLAQHIQAHVGIIAQDESEKQRVKMYGDALGKMMNLVRAYEQRLQEAMQQQAQQGGDPAATAEIQAKLMAAQTDAQIKQAKADQQLQQKQEAFNADQARKNAAVEMEGQRKMQQAKVDTATKDLKTRAEIANQTKKAAANGSKEDRERD